MRKPQVILELDGEAVPINPFVQKIFMNILTGMVRSLDRVKENPREIRLTIMQEVKR